MMMTLCQYFLWACSWVPDCDSWSAWERFDGFWGPRESLNTTVVTRAWFNIMAISTFFCKNGCVRHTLCLRNDLELPKTQQYLMKRKRWRGAWKWMVHMTGQRWSWEELWISKCLRQSGLILKMAFRIH